jgi:hypothetical protein
MPPAVFIDLGFEAARHPRRVPVVGRVADRAGRTRGAARTSVRAFPGLIRVALTDPAAVLAEGAFHRSHQMERKRELCSIGGMPKNEVLQMRRHLAQL